MKIMAIQPFQGICIPVTAPLPTLFVSIASYRDPECQFTVNDLFRKAAHPERIRVGICWQYEPDSDADCFMLDSPCPGQTRSLRYLAWESKGGCWARSQAHALAEGEDYILQIDAHTRFVPGWDNLLIETLGNCPADRAVLSTSPPPYTPVDNLENMEGHCSVTVILKLHGREGLQPVSIGGNKRPLRHIRVRGPIPTPFVTANFIFARRQMFEEVPYDPHLYFRGQESTYALRLFTHGYNCYHPDRTVLYHYWDAQTRRDPRLPGSGYKDSSDATPAAQLARQRVWHLLGLKMAENQAALVDLERYGLGRVRSAEAFWRFAGINLDTLEMTPAAREGHWQHPAE